jgi:hypothetical protein
MSAVRCVHVQMAGVPVAQVELVQVKMPELQMAEAAHKREHAQHQADAEADEIPVLRTE